MPTRASKKKKRPRDTNVLAWQVVQEATGQAPPEPEDTRNPAAVALAALFKETCAYLELDPDGLVLHSDNGGPMKGSTMLATLQRLGVVPSFSRPHVSDDNPYSEALFRTAQVSPGIPFRGFLIARARPGVDHFFRHLVQHGASAQCHTLRHSG